MKKKFLTFLVILNILLTGCLDRTSEYPPRDTWKTYTNIRYLYSFQYPPDMEIVDEDEHAKISLSGVPSKFRMFQTYPEIFRIRAQRPISSDVVLKEFVENAWKLNKEDASQEKVVGDIKKITVGGRTTYQFTITGSIKDDPTLLDYSIELLAQEHTVTYLEYKGVIFRILFGSNLEESSQILDTFEFPEEGE